jgi:hypothetical protein
MAQRELRGTLGRNEKHEAGSNQPSYKGSCMIMEGKRAHGSVVGPFDPRALTKTKSPTTAAGRVIGQGHACRRGWRHLG